MNETIYNRLDQALTLIEEKYPEHAEICNRLFDESQASCEALAYSETSTLDLALDLIYQAKTEVVFQVRNRETSDVIHTCATVEEAQRDLNREEAYDREAGNYVENRYEIYDLMSETAICKK